MQKISKLQVVRDYYKTFNQYAEKTRSIGNLPSLSAQTVLDGG